MVVSMVVSRKLSLRTSPACLRHGAKSDSTLPYPQRQYMPSRSRNSTTAIARLSLAAPCVLEFDHHHGDVVLTRRRAPMAVLQFEEPGDRLRQRRLAGRLEVSLQLPFVDLPSLVVEAF